MSLFGIFNEIKINRNPRPKEKNLPIISKTMASDLSYFGKVALKRKSAASLILNLEDQDYCTANVCALTSACRLEANKSLRHGMHTLIDLGGYVQPSEIYGVTFIERLKALYRFR